MSSACPDFPGPLFHALGYTYVEHNPDERLRATQDEQYQSAYRTACADPDARIAAVEALHGDQRTQATHDICDFQRFGLLESGEPFYYEDIPAVLAQHWMLEHRVDPVHGRRFNRGLMLATADERLSRRRCHARPDSLACQTLMRAHGSGLPVSSAQLDVAHGTSVFMTPTWRAVGNPNGIVDASTLADSSTLLMPRDRGGVDDVLLYADRRTPWSQVLELMRSAHAHNYHILSMVTAGVDDNARLQVAPPALWSAEGKSVAELQRAARFPVLVIEDDAVRLPDGGMVSLAEVEQLRGIARGLLGDAEDMPIVVRARADVELQTVVTVLEALPERECTLDGVLEPGEGCFALLPRIDLDPPTQRRPGDWSQLRLTKPQMSKAWHRQPGPATLDDLKSRIEQALEPIRACLIASDDARVYMPERMIIAFGLDARDQLGLHLFGPLREWLPRDCIAQALDMPVISSPADASATMFVDAEMYIELPD
jgi:biopolymer transport protein ExbD